MTALRACGVSELELDTPLRVELDGVAMAIVKDAARRRRTTGPAATYSSSP